MHRRRARNASATACAISLMAGSAGAAETDAGANAVANANPQSPTTSACKGSRSCDQWLPSLGLGLGFNWQQTTGDLDATPAPGVSFDAFANSEGSTLFKPTLTPDLMIESQALSESFGKPRAFLQLGATFPLGEESTVNNVVGETGGVAEDPQLFLTIEWDAQWYTGVGVSFEVPIASRIVIVKPAFNYIGQSIEWVATAEQQIDTALGSPLVPFTTSEAQIHHGLAGSLQIETDLDSIGPVTPAVFIRGLVGAWIWGDRTALLPVDTFASDGRASFVTTSQAELEALHFSLGVGIRLTWTGS